MGGSSTLPSAQAWSRGVGGWLGGASDAVVSVFFPARSRICNKLLVPSSCVPISEPCLNSFAALAEKCEVSGEALGWLMHGEGEPLVCRACQQKTYAFERARSHGICDGLLAKAILLLKRERMKALPAWFAERLAETILYQGGSFAADVVVPVPLARGSRTPARAQPGRAYFEAPGAEAGIAS